MGLIQASAVAPGKGAGTGRTDTWVGGQRPKIEGIGRDTHKNQKGRGDAMPDLRGRKDDETHQRGVCVCVSLTARPVAMCARTLVVICSTKRTVRLSFILTIAFPRWPPALLSNIPPFP